METLSVAPDKLTARIYVKALAKLDRYDLGAEAVLAFMV